METISRTILYQDKNFDGTGFPDDRTFGENIPVIARLLHLLYALLDLIGDDDLTNEHFINIANFGIIDWFNSCLLYTSPSPRDRQKYRMPSSA